MSTRKDWNAPENWLGWLRTCQKGPQNECPNCQIRSVPLGMITGTDARVLRAIASLWALCGYYPDDPCHQAALQGIRALLPCMQEKCWPFARELIAQALDWHMRDRLWPLVLPGGKAPGRGDITAFETSRLKPVSDREGHPVGHVRVKPS